jgi:hypothetical protein
MPCGKVFNGRGLANFCLGRAGLGIGNWFTAHEKSRQLTIPIEKPILNYEKQHENL